MIEKERLARRAKQLRISSITLAENMRTSNFKSLFRGLGIEFSDVRDYLPGDNVRSIDWNVTARMGKPFIKQYEEDRELNVFLIVDCSSSMKTGSKGTTRLKTAGEAAALMLLAASLNAGACGAVLFDGEIKFSCPPKSGSKNAMMILSRLDKMESGEFDSMEVPGSVLSSAISGAQKVLKKRSLIFIFSDFRTSGWEQDFARLAEKNDVIAVRITDPTDSELPEIGTVPFVDCENGSKLILPTASRSFKQAWLEDNKKRTDYWKEFCTKHGASIMQISTTEDCATALSRFFAQKSAPHKTTLWSAR